MGIAARSIMSMDRPREAQVTAPKVPVVQPAEYTVIVTPGHWVEALCVETGNSGHGTTEEEALAVLQDGMEDELGLPSGSIRLRVVDRRSA